IDAARLTSHIGAARGRESIAATLVQSLVEVFAADAALAWLPHGAIDASSVPAIGSGFLADVAAEDLTVAARSEKIADWLTTRGAGFSLVAECGLPAGRFAVCWKARPPIDPQACSTALELVSGQVAACLEQDRLAQELASVRAALDEAEGQMGRTRRARAVG